MATAKKRAEAGTERRGRGRPPKALATRKAMFVVEERHLRALRAEAFRRAQERGSGVIDSSEVLREVLDAWIEKTG